jgi:hypothetical protein
VTNFDETAFLASGVLGPAATFPRGVWVLVLVPRPLRAAVGGGVTSSSPPPCIFLLSLKVILDPEPDVDMPCGVLVTEGGRAVVSGVTPTVSK